MPNSVDWKYLIHLYVEIIKFNSWITHLKFYLEIQPITIVVKSSADIKSSKGAFFFKAINYKRFPQFIYNESLVDKSLCPFPEENSFRVCAEEPN